jgi:predicted nucleic-acid-binding protein
VRAIDTNVVVRLLTADDAVQAQTARAVVEAGDVFIGSTVVLETEWVLRAGYDFAAAEIAEGLRGLFGLAAVTLEEPIAVGLALDWMAAGMDFADALHVARSEHCSAFLSFDRNLVKRARGITSVPVESP